MSTFQKIALGLACIIGGNTPVMASTNEAILKIQTPHELACRGLLACPGLLICPDCSGTPPTTAFLTVSNTSNVLASRVTVSAAYPSFSTYVAQSGSCGASPFNLAPGSSCVVEFSTTATESVYPFLTTITVAASNSASVTTPFEYIKNG